MQVPGIRLHHVMLRHFGEGKIGLPAVNFVNASGFLLSPKHQGVGRLFIEH